MSKAIWKEIDGICTACDERGSVEYLASDVSPKIFYCSSCKSMAKYDDYILWGVGIIIILGAF